MLFVIKKVVIFQKMFVINNYGKIVHSYWLKRKLLQSVLLYTTTEHFSNQFYH